MIDDKVLAKLFKQAETEVFIKVPQIVMIELIRAYQHHKRVLPLHQKIAEACKELGF